MGTIFAVSAVSPFLYHMQFYSDIPQKAKQYRDPVSIYILPLPQKNYFSLCVFAILISNDQIFNKVFFTALLIKMPVNEDFPDSQKNVLVHFLLQFFRHP